MRIGTSLLRNAKKKVQGCRILDKILYMRPRNLKVEMQGPPARTKTTIGLAAAIEVFIYYLGPPAVVCHRGPPSTTRARVEVKCWQNR